MWTWFWIAEYLTGQIDEIILACPSLNCCLKAGIPAGCGCGGATAAVAAAAAAPLLILLLLLLPRGDERQLEEPARQLLRQDGVVSIHR